MADVRFVRRLAVGMLVLTVASCGTGRGTVLSGEDAARGQSAAANGPADSASPTEDETSAALKALPVCKALSDPAYAWVVPPAKGTDEYRQGALGAVSRFLSWYPLLADLAAAALEADRAAPDETFDASSSKGDRPVVARDQYGNEILLLERDPADPDSVRFGVEILGHPAFALVASASDWDVKPPQGWVVDTWYSCGELASVLSPS